jgi:hypothetical protein
MEGVHAKLEGKIEAAILCLLAERGKGKTICPSEVARAVAGSDERDLWEPLMKPVRAVATRMAGEEKIVITQRGLVVDGASAKGAVRFRSR